jgi:hypothetical protein
LARAKQEAESAQKEIERLKAALTEKEATQAKAATTAAAAAVAKSADSASKAANAAKMADTASKPAAAAPTEVAKATPAAAPAGGNGLIKLSSQDQVLRELQTTAELVSHAGKDESEASLILYIKTPGTKTTNKDKIPLRALGNNQYRGGTKIEAGDYEAVIGFNHWPVQFSAAESGDITILCDYRNSGSPRVVIYQKALEGSK